MLPQQLDEKFSHINPVKSLKISLDEDHTSMVNLIESHQKPKRRETITESIILKVKEMTVEKARVIDEFISSRLEVKA